MKPNVIFFSRSYQTKLFPLLKSEKYESVHVTLTYKEKKHIESLGLENKYCFEVYEKYSEYLPLDYLITSFKSDRFLGKHDFETRIKILRKEKAFWEEILEHYNPIAVINEQVAIEIAEVLYIESRKRKIRYLAWMNSPINGYFYWIKDPITLSLDDSIIENEISEVSLSRAKEYIDKLKEKREIPYYLNPYLNENKYKKILSVSRNLIVTTIKHIFNNPKNNYEDFLASACNSFERAFKKVFYKYDELENIKKYEIILYPLHYEPESSLSYLSEFNSNQVLFLENVLKCISQNQVLVVKEHPAQAGMLLTKKYQKIKKESSGLFFLPHDSNSQEIIMLSEVIITLTSHLGWEALIMGKPVFLLGNMFYDKYSHINKVINFNELRKKIRKRDYLSPDKKLLINYMAKIIEVSYVGEPFMGNNLFSVKNIENLIKAIEKELNL